MEKVCEWGACEQRADRTSGQTDTALMAPYFFKRYKKIDACDIIFCGLLLPFL